ncbi:CKLF-like MARVEL transmembrane domain-containing protein 4 [Glandiceps talaboti]
MESTTTTVTTTQTTRVQPAISCDINYFKTIRGIIKIVQCVLDMITFICATSDWRYRFYSEYQFHQFVSMTCFLLTLILIIFYVTRLLYRIPIPWIIVEFFYCCGVCAMYLISSSVVAANSFGIAGLEAAAVFGFFALVSYAVEGAFLFRDWRGGIRTPDGGATTTSQPARTSEMVVTETKHEAPPAYEPGP